MVSKELKEKIVAFVMDGEDVLDIGWEFGDPEDSKQFTKSEVIKLVDECKSCLQLESLLLDEFEMREFFTFGEILDCI